MRVVLAVLACILTSACGGEYGTEPGWHSSDNRKLDPALAGTWGGRATISTNTAVIGSVDAVLSLGVDGAHAMLQGVCLDGTGSIQAEGNGRNTMWYDTVVCPHPTADCRDGTLRFTSGIIDLRDDANAYFTMYGVATLCGAETEVFVSLPTTRY